MEVEFHTIDVFTDRAFMGNPVAVVPDASDLTKAQMQIIAAEFGYSETAFLLPPQSRSALARIRVFTPRSEVAFAGQPTIGAAFVLGRLGAVYGRSTGLRMTLEAEAGAIGAELVREGATLVGASIRSPQPFAKGPDIAPEVVARCANLAASDILTLHHVPLIASAGMPFILAELRGMEVLQRARPDAEAFAAHFPVGVAKGMHLYVSSGAADTGMDLIARTFTPLHGIDEDIATGSANAALAGLFMLLSAAKKRSFLLRATVAQGSARDRSGLVEALAERVDGTGAEIQTWVRGRCAPVMRGHLRVPDEQGWRLAS